jgi:hypothetical protein
MDAGPWKSCMTACIDRLDVYSTTKESNIQCMHMKLFLHHFLMSRRDVGMDPICQFLPKVEHHATVQILKPTGDCRMLQEQHTSTCVALISSYQE